MDRSQALQLLEESFARGSNTPCSWASDRNAYIAEQQDKLRACVVDPFLTLVATGEWAQKHCSRSAEPYPLYTIAKLGSQWLFYSEPTGEFFLGYGDLGNPEGLSMLGFSSSDALAEWLG
ncbi:hypothetical protein [Lysobacter sp. HA35]